MPGCSGALEVWGSCLVAFADRKRFEGIPQQAKKNLCQGILFSMIL